MIKSRLECSTRKAAVSVVNLEFTATVQPGPTMSREMGAQPYLPNPAQVREAQQRKDRARSIEARAEPTRTTSIAAELLGTLLDAGRQLEKDKKETDELGLAPAKGLRQRRKSRDLQEQANRIMKSDLKEVFTQFDVDGSGALFAVENSNSCSLHQAASHRAHHTSPCTWIVSYLVSLQGQ